MLLNFYEKIAYFISVLLIIKFILSVLKTIINYYLSKNNNLINFQPVNEEVNIFKAQLRTEARGRFFERELSKLLTSDELKVK